MATIGELTAKLGLDNSGFSKGIRESTGQLNQLGKTIKESADKLKDFANGIKEKAQAMVASVKATIDQNKALSASQLAWKAATVATNAFKVALASTGIGLIVVALGSLVAYLTTTQEGMDKLRRFTEPVAEIFRRLLGVLQDLGGNVFKGIAQMLNGELKEGFKTLANGASQAGKATVSAFKEGAAAGKELADLQVQIEEAQNDLILTSSKLNKQIAEQRNLAKNARTEEERSNARQKALELIDQLTAAESKVLDLQIRRLKLSQQANDTDRKGKAELLKLIAEQDEIETRALNQKRRLLETNTGLLGDEINATQSLISLQREQLGIFLAMSKGMGQGVRRDPFNLEEAPKYSKEVLNNISKISDKLVNPKLTTERLSFTPEQIASVKEMTDRQMAHNNAIALAEFSVQSLGQVFQNAFAAMLMSGNMTFKGLMDGLKAMIARLVAAAAAALALSVILSTIPGFAAAGTSVKFKDLFLSLAGLPKMAKGGMVTGLTTAVLGDNPSGKEAIIPFERMGEFLNQFGGGGSQRVEVVGNFRNDAIYFSNASYSQRRNRILGF
jgi:hypothetical protein